MYSLKHIFNCDPVKTLLSRLASARYGETLIAILFALDPGRSLFASPADCYRCFEVSGYGGALRWSGCLTVLLIGSLVDSRFFVHPTHSCVCALCRSYKVRVYTIRCESLRLDIKPFLSGAFSFLCSGPARETSFLFSSCAVHHDQSSRPWSELCVLADPFLIITVLVVV